MSPAEQLADEVLLLINKSPRTPTRAQLVDTISVMLDVVQEDAITVPLGTVVHPLKPGAHVMVMENMSLQIDGWNVSSPRPLTLQEAALAILEWMKRGVLTAPRQ